MSFNLKYDLFIFLVQFAYIKVISSMLACCGLLHVAV